MKTAEIFSIGDEILRGIVADTNSHWMAQRITARGAALERVTVLADSPPLVAKELRAALGREPAVVFTQGGLGPTDDDRTRYAIALALGVPLEHNADAERIVATRYTALAAAGTIPDASITEARARMSLVPRGALPLDNGIGGAPGLLVQTGATHVACLPGVPQELRWIWENSLAPHLDSILGPGGYDEITLLLEERDESRIAETVCDVATRHPRVYVKSRATAFGEPDERVRVTLSALGETDPDARALVDAAERDVRAGLGALGVAVASTSGRNATT